MPRRTQLHITVDISNRTAAAMLTLPVILPPIDEQTDAGDMQLLFADKIECHASEELPIS